MRLSTWIALQGRGSIAALARATGKRYHTIHALARGATRATYQTALLIQKATGGLVTVAELCSPDDAPTEATSPEETHDHGNTEARHAR